MSICYDSAHLLIYRRAVGLLPINTTIMEGPWDAFVMFTMYAHERAGTNPNFGYLQRRSVREAMKARKFEEAVTHPTFADEVWQNFVRLTREKPNERVTYGVVRDFLVELRKSSEPNWIKLLRRKDPLEAFNWLDDLRGMAEKLSAFIVRDLTTIMKLWEVKQEQLYLLQPLDTWVIDWSKRCWAGVFEVRDATLGKMKAVTDRCISEGVDPAEFNKGAWFVGSHFNDICSFFRINESDRQEREKCVSNFDAQKLQVAIIEYSKGFDTGTFFAP
jgi:hypothetical protein